MSYIPTLLKLAATLALTLEGCCAFTPISAPHGTPSVSSSHAQGVICLQATVSRDGSHHTEAVKASPPTGEVAFKRVCRNTPHNGKGGDVSSSSGGDPSLSGGVLLVLPGLGGCISDSQLSCVCQEPCEIWKM
ncbi:unnamed protein product, partial [Chrysoparadoxa australica]